MPTLRELREEQAAAAVVASTGAGVHPAAPPVSHRDTLQQVLDVQRHAWASDTTRRRDVAMEEFGVWLAQYGDGANLTTCTPEHVLVYMHGYWIPRRSVSGRVVAPQTVLVQL